MSVLKNKREDSAVEYLNTAHELEKFTIQRTARDIPKTYTFSLRTPLIESVRNINKYVVYSSNIKLCTEDDYNRIYNYLNSAVIELQNLLELMRLTSEILPIKDTVLETWTGLVLKEEYAIKSQMKYLAHNKHVGV